MRHARVLSAVFGLMCVVMAPGPAHAADDRETLIDKIVAKADPRVMEVLVTSKDKDGRPEFRTIKVPDVAAAKLQIDKLLGAPGVLGVEMNHIVHLATNDQFYPQQWAVDAQHLKVDKVLAITASDTRNPPVVAVVDTGVQASHPDLGGRVFAGYNIIQNRAGQSDGCGHGTHVAGIIAATANNGIGIAGLASRVSILPVKVLKPDPFGSCSGDAADVAAGIRWAADKANVINLSIQDTASSPAMSNAVQDAHNHGRAVVAAAGNTGCPVLGRPTIYPAAYSGVVGVAAAQDSGTAPYWRGASYSSCGSWVDVTAPGSDILSTCRGSGYCYMSGTSMAAPYTAATVALGMQHCGWSAKKAGEKVQSTASQYPTKSNTIGYGMIKPPKLLTCG